MTELKLRLRTIDTVLLNDKVLHGTINREFCYLQLRMSCEVLALACLVAHGDVGAARVARLQKRYKADEIMKMLEEINPEFYPKSVRQQRKEGFVHFADFTEPVLTKEELFKLYRKCSGVLHRGSMKRLLSTTDALPASNSDVQGVLKKFWELLYQHHIPLVNGDHLVCLLENSSDNNRVQVVRAGPILQEP